MSIDAVLLIAFGGPTAPEHVMPFLENVTRGRGIPPERLAVVARQYERIGGRSPLTDLTLAETLAELAAAGARRVLGIILSVARSEASWDRYIEDVRQAGARVGSTAPEVV